MCTDMLTHETMHIYALTMTCNKFNMHARP